MGSGVDFVHERTALANKAIALAWHKEQELIKEGKGTRDWTPEQQQDIIDKGKAYDENGKAFHGQHMKSVECFPAYQGEPGNIQFLTKDEHLAAHEGSWLNPTNWYYDPVTKEKTIFDSNEFVPCKIIELSDPISFPNNTNIDRSKDALKKENIKQDITSTGIASTDTDFDEQRKAYLAEEKKERKKREKRGKRTFFIVYMIVIYNLFS